MPVTWDITMERKLLITIIELVGIKTPPWADVAAAMGNTVTGEACRQHFNKIRKTGREAGAAPANASPATPRKRARASASTPGSATKANSAKKARTINSRGKKATPPLDDEDEHYEPEVSPTKTKNDPDAQPQGTLFKIEKLSGEDAEALLGNAAVKEGEAKKPIDLEADGDLYD